MFPSNFYLGGENEGWEFSLKGVIFDSYVKLRNVLHRRKRKVTLTSFLKRLLLLMLRPKRYTGILWEDKLGKRCPNHIKQNCMVWRTVDNSEWRIVVEWWGWTARHVVGASGVTLYLGEGFDLSPEGERDTRKWHHEIWALDISSESR